MFGSRTAATADVIFNADIGQFRADVSQAEQVYERSTGAMSDAALRHSIAQEKVNRAIKRYGPESLQARQATLSYRTEMRSLQQQADRTEREIDQTRRTLERTNREARSSGLSWRGLRSSIGIATAGLLGTGGVIYALRSAASAAKEQELILGQTRVALETAGLSWERYGKRIQETITRQSRLGFDDEELLKTFQLFVRATGDVDTALERNALSLDVARGRYLSLEQGAQIVLKAQLGMSGALRRAGIDVEKGASSVELLDLLTRKYAGSAEEASRTATGATDRLAVAWENAKEVVGTGLLPSIVELSDEAEAWLSDAENMRRLQEAVNDLVGDGTQVVRGLAGALRIARTATTPLVNALGGIESTVKLMTLAWLAFKAKSAISFAATAAASALTSRKMVADAVVAGRAWDLATRPRHLLVTGGGGAAAAGVPAGGRPGFPGTTGTRGLGAIGVAGVIATGVVLGGVGQPPSLREQQRRVSDLARVDPAAARRLARDFNREHGTSLRDLLDNNPFGASGLTVPNRDPVGSRGDRDRPNMGRAVPPPRGGRGQRPDRFTLSDVTRGRARLEESFLDAQLTRGTADDVRVLSEELRLVSRAIDELKLSGDQRMELKQRRLAILREIESIRDAEQAEAERIREQRLAKRKAQAKASKARMDAIMRDAEKAAERRGELLAGTGGSRENMRRQALKHVDAVTKALQDKRDKEKSLTRAEVRAMQFEFLRDLQGTMNRFGGNLFAPGSLEVAGTGPNPDLFAIVNELREQTGVLVGLASGVRNPGTRQARTELGVAFEGPTF